MRKYAYIKIITAVFVVSLLFIGVSQIVIADGNAVHLRFGQSVTKQGMTITFVDVSDSRCPADVQCIWAGEVIVSLHVKVGSGEVKDAELRQSMGGEYTVIEGKKLQLKTVTPHPRTDQDYDDSDYRAVIEITDENAVDVQK
ncbi:MAG: hypothetical protein ACRBDL_02460 [Alphaproteobacteria bacterium]